MLFFNPAVGEENFYFCSPPLSSNVSCPLETAGTQANVWFKFRKQGENHCKGECLDINCNKPSSAEQLENYLKSAVAATEANAGMVNRSLKNNVSQNFDINV